MSLQQPSYPFRAGLIVLFCVIMHIETWGQIDSLLIAPFKEKKSLTYGFNNRRTYLFNQPSPIYGLYVGIQYGKRLKHVITLNSNIFWVGEDQQLRLSYAGFAEEFTFLQLKRFVFISYIHAGLGTVTFRDPTTLGQNIIARDVVSPVELGIHSSFKIYEWLKLNGGAGYRVVLLDESKQLNNIYYKVGVSINLKELQVFWHARQQKSKNKKI